MPIHPPGRNLAETLEEDRELVLLADALGFTEGYIGEHITDAAETITSALIFIAWLLRETKRIRLGTGTVNLPNHHPAMVAAEVAMVDHLAKGRFIFGISPGGLLSDAEVFGNLEQDRTAMFVEAINHILDIWANAPPYDLKGQFWTISTARTLIPELGQGVIAKPYQKPHPPIVVTAVAPYSKRGHRGGRARLGSDLGELPAAAVGQDALAELRRGMRERRPQRRSGELAGREEHLRRR
jgi:alkanesulfonate monooxygenase SsuD/methylene tetrahydromethanopterin reductase-like flavin-dependent oxidoreductase (luciferase family)